MPAALTEGYGEAVMEYDLTVYNWSALRPGAIIINTSTSAPRLSRRLSEAALGRGVSSVVRAMEEIACVKA